MTPYQSWIWTLPGNDSLTLAAGHNGDVGSVQTIPAGHKWTLEYISEQFYSPYEHEVNQPTVPVNPQQAMFHVVVNFGGVDGNLHTQILRTQDLHTNETPSRFFPGNSEGDRKYFDYRNHKMCVPIVGPSTVRLYAYNQTGWSVIFGFFALWSREIVS